MNRRVRREDSVVPFPHSQFMAPVEKFQHPPFNKRDAINEPPVGHLFMSPSPQNETSRDVWSWEEPHRSHVHRTLSWSHNGNDKRICDTKDHYVTNSSPSPIAASIAESDDTNDNNNNLDSRISVKSDKENTNMGRRAVLLRTNGDNDRVLIKPHLRENNSSFCSNNHLRTEGGISDKFSVPSNLSPTIKTVFPQPTETISTPDHIYTLIKAMGNLEQAVLQLTGEVRDLRLEFQCMKDSIINKRENKPDQDNVTEPTGAEKKSHCGNSATPVLDCHQTSLQSLNRLQRISASSPPLLADNSAALLDVGIIDAMSEGLKELEALPSFLPIGYRVAIDESHHRQ